MDEGKELEGALREWLAGAGTVVVAGIGNPIRRDDHAGVRVVEGLRGAVSPRVHLIECETVPESFVDEIVDVSPTHVLLIDAALLGLPPGTVDLYDVEEVAATAGIATHALPLRVLCEYVTLLTGARIALLLIEPEDTGFGEGMTPGLEAATRRTVGMLKALLP